MEPFVALLTGGQPGVQAQQLQQLAALSTPDADNDGDGRSNAAELLAGTDPYDASDVFRITNAILKDGALHLTWPTFPGRRYRVTQSRDLHGGWVPVEGTDTIEGDGSPMMVTVPLTVESKSRFYRVEALSSPLER